MEPSASNPRTKILPSLGYTLFGIINVVMVVFILDSILRERLGFNGFAILIGIPFFSLLAFVGFYALYKTTRPSYKEVPRSRKRLFFTAVGLLLYVGFILFSIWTTIDSIASCRMAMERGRETLAKVEKISLEWKLIGNRPRSIIDVQTPAEANQLRVKLSFTAEGRTITYDPAPYLPNHDAIAKVYNEAKTGVLKVRYLPEDPATFFVAAAPCRESIFAVFIQE